MKYGETGSLKAMYYERENFPHTHAKTREFFKYKDYRINTEVGVRTLKLENGETLIADAEKAEALATH